MPELPPEILSAVVDELANDRKTLVMLLFVSSQFNLLALRPLYQEISYVMRRLDESLIHKLGCLARDVENNPGVHFTTTFSFVLKGHHDDPPIPLEQIEEAIKRVVPYLVNVNHICISMPGAVDARILWPLAAGAPLTHLRILECSLKSDYLRHFLTSRTTLQSLEIDCFPFGTWRMNLIPIKLPPGSFPPLRSLSLPLRELVFFEESLPSLVNLDLTEYVYGSLETNLETICRMVMPFASIRTLSFHNIHLPYITSLVSQFTNLEYLWLHPSFPRQSPLPTSQLPLHPSTRDIIYNYDLLSTTKLKYIRCSSFDEKMGLLGLRLFDTVQTLVVVDITSQENRTFRMYKGMDGFIFVARSSDEWEGWWERAQRAVANVNAPGYRPSYSEF